MRVRPELNDEGATERLDLSTGCHAVQIFIGRHTNWSAKRPLANECETSRLTVIDGWAGRCHGVRPPNASCDDVVCYQWCHQTAMDQTVFYALCIGAHSVSCSCTTRSRDETKCGNVIVTACEWMCIRTHVTTQDIANREFKINVTLTVTSGNTFFAKKLIHNGHCVTSKTVSTRKMQ